jgi:hypothetical protein
LAKIFSIASAPTVMTGPDLVAVDRLGDVRRNVTHEAADLLNRRREDEPVVLPQNARPQPGICLPLQVLAEHVHRHLGKSQRAPGLLRLGVSVARTERHTSTCGGTGGSASGFPL